ncbi:MAG: glycoside hydrolase, partial [Terriglobales bacterium]
FPYWVYGSQQDSGTAATSSRGNDGQITERDWFPVGPGESGYTIPDPLDPDVVYNAGPVGSVVRLSKKTGQVRDISPGPIPFGTKYRFNWNIPMAFSPQDPHVLFLGTQFVLKTVNGGTSWEAISPDLTRTPADEKNPKKPLGSLMTIAPSSVAEGVIWAGSDDGAVQLTRDGGATWQNVTPPVVSEWSAVPLIEVSHFDAGTAYVAVNRNSLDDLRPHIFQTHDFGHTWQETVSGIGATDFVRVVREDPVRKNLLYAGTEQGAYVSFNGGGHWQSLRLNMPMAAVHDLAIEQDDLIAATYGRSFWILDDLSPLRQIDAQSPPAKAVLFAPRPAIRIRRDENQDTPLPPEIPAGKNPPDGAILDYFLPAATASDIQLEIYDAEGKLIRAFSSAPLPAVHEQPLQIAEYWIAHPQPLAKAPGMHRFVWDLRYADPQAVHVQTPYNYPMGAIVGETPLPPQGPLVLPGTYEVRFTVDGQTFRQPLEVKMDPQVNYARYELESSLNLQLKISATLGRNFAAYQQVKDLRSRLTEFAKRPAADPTATAATQLDSKAEALEGKSVYILDTPKGGSFITVNDSLVSLIGLVDGADFAPSAESFAALQRVCAAMNGTLEEWQKLKDNELAAFRKLVETQKSGAIPDYPAITVAANCGR